MFIVALNHSISGIFVQFWISQTNEENKQKLALSKSLIFAIGNSNYVKQN